MMILIRPCIKNLPLLTLALITEYRETNERNQPFITVTDLRLGLLAIPFSPIPFAGLKNGHGKLPS